MKDYGDVTHCYSCEKVDCFYEIKECYFPKQEIASFMTSKNKDILGSIFYRTQ